MAGNALIGALKVSLGIDSAEFSAGLKKAQLGLASFGKVAAVGFGAAATAAVAAGAALAVAGKRAIDTADNMSKAAQKVGVATEALSRLNYAAGYSDVSLEQLSGGLQKLSKNLADVASGKGGSAATALQALGISATDATGKLRGSDEVFADIADRFGRLEDGSTKTALAIQLFGRSGADLIPLLNSGRDGLKSMADESDRLGLTISTKTGRAAEQFNDTLTKIGRIVEGVAMKVAEAALPALQELADLLASPEVAEAAQTLGTTLVTAFDAVVRAVVATTEAISQFFDWLDQQSPGNASSATLAKQLADQREYLRLAQGEKAKSSGFSVLGMFGAGVDDRIAGYQQNIAKLEAELGRRQFMDPAGRGASFGQLSGFAMGGGEGGAFNTPTFGDGGAGEAMARRLEALRESLRTEEESERESYARRREEIQKFYDDGVIQRGEYDELMLKSQQEHADRMVEIAKEQAEKEAQIREALVDNVAGVFGSLATIAENMGERGLAASKAFGVAEAVINTAQGITKALAQGGILGFAGAAAVAAAGAAQISTILSASKGSTSKPSVGGSAGDVSTPATATAARSISINLQGDTFSKEAVGSLFDRLSEELGIDGLQLVTTYKQA